MRIIDRLKTLLVNKRGIVRLVLSVIAFGVLLSLAIYFMDNDFTNTKYRKRYIEYGDDWTVIIDGEKTRHDLPAYVKSGKDSEIVLKKTLPDPIPKYSAIATRNYHQIMEVSLNGEVIYTYPGENWDGITKIISDEWCVINLSSDSSRGVLEIKLKNEANTPFFGYIKDIYFGDDNSIIQHIRESNYKSFISGVILITLGAILVMLSFIYRKPTNQAPNSAMGVVLFCFGIWMCNRAKMPFFTTDNTAVFLISLFALMMSGPFVFLYCYYRNPIYRNISIIAFKITLGIDFLIMLISFFVPLNVQYISMFAYATILLAFIFNGFLLHKNSIGDAAKLRGKTELLLDRTELMTNMLFPIAGVLEMFVSRNQLWTEVSYPFRIIVDIYGFIYMLFVLWRTYLVVQDRVVVSERLQESQLELMMGQIQPHFIFNTLSSIRTLVKIEPDVAYKMLYDFSNYLRANVDNVTNLDGIKFAAEVNHIKSYVNIEKVRFGDRLNVEYEIDEADFTVPPLSIQPLVENAIKHGVVKKLEGGTVWLRSYQEEDYYVVEVADNGIGFDKAAASEVFSIDLDKDDSVGLESNKVVVAAMKDVMESLSLKDENGEPIILEGPTRRENLSGNGSEEHKSTGMMNIILRLREMANAKIEINSRTGSGTVIRVRIPKK